MKRTVEREVGGGTDIPHSRIEGEKNRGRLGEMRDARKNEGEWRHTGWTRWMEPQPLNQRSGRKNWKPGKRWAWGGFTVVEGWFWMGYDLKLW